MRDERGRLYLLWKEDGNEFRRPTPILAQRLSEDGRRLRGRPRELIRSREPWEGRIVEAPTVVRHGGYFYLFYSANRCCTEECAYAVGVARSPTLLGRWERYPGNPILRDGNGWRCPGHVSLVADAGGSLKALFHAFRTGAGVLIGRQLLVDDVTFGQDGWPRIGAGVPAPPRAEGTARVLRLVRRALPGPGVGVAGGAAPTRQGGRRPAAEGIAARWTAGGRRGTVAPDVERPLRGHRGG